MDSLCLVRSSINIDSMFAVSRVVRPGETLSSSSMMQRPGGKGANVSAAVALAEQQVYMCGSVGKDATWPIDEMASRGVRTEKIRILQDAPTGRAFIQVADDGENSIVLLKGANFHPDTIADNPAEVFASLPRHPTHLILQNEIPLQVTKQFLHHAHLSEPHTLTIFNPSPMLSEAELHDFAWSEVDVLIVNEGEGSDLVEAMSSQSKNSQDVLEQLAMLQELEATRWIVMTRGSRGVSAIVRSTGKRIRIDIPAAKPKCVRDTTGAGDTFAGNLVAGLMRLGSEQFELQNVTQAQAEDVLQWAAAAAAVAVESDGAMESIPRLQDVASRQKELV